MGALTNLTPFRHHGLYRYRRLQSALQRYEIECSTPFGITDYIRTDVTEGTATVKRCSTPFGITDYIGSETAASERERVKCSTPFGITDYIGWQPVDPAARRRTCAQRLSASRIISATPPQPPSTAWSSAQRLSASRIISAGRHRVHVGCPGPPVLNAFRHHGLYRESVTAQAPFDTRRPCAQRLSASRIISEERLSGTSARIFRECSTPFGITDYIGTGGFITDGDQGAACSTPFGITDYIGSWTDPPPHARR